MISTVFIVYDILPGDFANFLLSFATGAPRALPSAARERAAELGPRGKFRYIFTAKFTAYCR